MAEPYGPGNYPPQIDFDNSGEDSMTQQSFLQEADINYIMAKFNQGVHDANLPLPNTPSYNPYGTDVAFGGVEPLAVRDDAFNAFADVSYHDMWNKVKAAEIAFLTMPSDLRARFNNNPQELLEFVQNPANEAEAIELGIMSDANLPAA